MFNRTRPANRDLLFIYLSVFLWGVGLYLYFYLQPLYITQLGATPAQVGLALGLGSFVVTFLYAPVGLWADRHGRKTVMLIGWSLGTLATFGMALAPDWRWFIPALSIYTLSNFAVAVLYGYISACAPPEQRGQAFALSASAISIGSIITPAIGGWLGERFGLRTVYLIAAIFYALSTLALAPLRNQPPEPRATSANARQLLSSRSFLSQIVFVFCLFFAVDVGVVLAPKFLEEVRGLSVNQIGWLGTFSAIGAALLVYLLSKLPSDGDWALMLGQLLALLGLLLLAITGLFPLLIVAFFMNPGNRLVRPPVLLRMSRLLDPSNLSFGLGIQQTAIQLGLALSPTVAGILYARNPAWPLYAGMAALVVTLVVSYLLSQNKATLAITQTPGSAVDVQRKSDDDPKSKYV